MRFAPSFLDEIRERVSISSLIGRRVQFDKKKTNVTRGDYWGCCPFHGEKSPSFHCEDQKGRYHCFGCGVSGDHFRFLTELEGMGFPEAVEHVAQMAGVPMPKADPMAQQKEQARASLHDVMEMATCYFEDMLQAAQGAKARAYLRERGLSGQTQGQFRLGYAPNSRNGLKEFLAQKGVEKQLIEACGLVVHGDGIAVSYDRFRDRIMFPILDIRKRVIAFGGRALSSDVPAKYLNSPETDLFSKGNVLYNHARARTSAQKSQRLVVVEGYMDVIALAQAGFDEAVAPLGTALTQAQLEMLWRVNGEPILCFDGDQAGIKAAWRAADLALPDISAGKSMRFALLPEGQDPDDLIKASGAASFDAILKGARPLVEILWSRETAQGVFDTPERRAELERSLNFLVAKIKDESVKHHYSQDMRARMASFLGQNNSPARSNYNQGKSGGQGRNWAPTKPWGNQGGRKGAAAPGRFAVSNSLSRSGLVKNQVSIMGLREAVIMVSVIHHPELIDEFFDEIQSLDLDHPGLRIILSELLNFVAQKNDCDAQEVLAHLRKGQTRSTLEEAQGLVRKMRVWPATLDAALDDARSGFCQALHLHRSARTLFKELKVAEVNLANDPTQANYSQLLDIQNQLNNASATEALLDGFGAASGRTSARRDVK